MGYILYPPHIKELKTKPFQHALNNLFQYGIRPHILILRSSHAIDAPRIEKISSASGIDPKFIIPLPDTDNIYEIPIKIAEYKQIIQLIADRITNKNATTKNKASGESLNKYKNFVKAITVIENSNNYVSIAMVGKYFGTGKFTLTDSYISVIESLKFAGWANKVKIKFKWIDSTKINSLQDISKIISHDIHAILVPGGFGSTGITGKLLAIQYARKNKIPYLGLCYGLQLAIVEFARNVLKLSAANTTEIDPNTPYPVIDILPEQKQILKNKEYGATMRLGDYKSYIKPGTIVYKLYKLRNRLHSDEHGTYVIERHRHRYEVNPKYHRKLEEAGLIFSGLSRDKKLVEFIELPEKQHPFFVATQAHPEFTSYPEDPNPLFWGFIRAAMNLIGKIQ